MVKRNCIAIIPARGGSKRIPKKNIMPFCGQPMLAWTIQAAIKSNAFDRVFVSTDSQEIADIANQFGSDVPFLREKHADDYSTVSQATAHALDAISSHLDETYEHVVQLMPNCPLRTPRSIISSLESFIIHKRAFQISCFEYAWCNPWWAFSMDAHGRPVRLFPEFSQSRSQDLQKLYCPSGAIWVAKVDMFMECRNFYGTGYKCLPIPWAEAIDIDTLDDLSIAEALSSSIFHNSYDTVPHNVDFIASE